MRTYFAICIALASATSSTLASADFFHQSLTGASCVDTQDAAPQIYYTSTGAAHNDATSAETFICPIPWTNVADDATGLGLSTHEIAWNVTMVSASVAVSCVVRACERDGTDCIQTDDVTGSSGTQFFSGDILSLGLNHQTAFLSCSVPGKSGSRSGIAAYSYFLSE